MIYQTLDGQFKEKIVSFWEAVKRLRKQDPLYQLPSDGRSVVTTLHINDCFILGMPDEDIKDHLNQGRSLWGNIYRVQRISSKYYEFRHKFSVKLNALFLMVYLGLIIINASGYFILKEIITFLEILLIVTIILSIYNYLKYPGRAVFKQIF